MNKVHITVELTKKSKKYSIIATIKIRLVNLVECVIYVWSK